MKPTTEQIASRFGCTPEQVRAQFARNAEGLAKMLARAESTGRKVNGYTADQLRQMVADTRARAA